MIDWHRALGFSGDNRAIGRAITGAGNAAFLFLALSGLYLWWPRKWTARVLRKSIWFRRGLSSRARDFNWHNVIGFWSLPGAHRGDRFGHGDLLRLGIEPALSGRGGSAAGCRGRTGRGATGARSVLAGRGTGPWTSTVCGWL